MLKLLAVLGYILLGIICFIAWVIIVPRTVHIEYTKKESWTIRLQIFIFKLKLYPWQFNKKDKTTAKASDSKGGEAVEKEPQKAQESKENIQPIQNQAKDNKPVDNKDKSIYEANIDKSDKENQQSSKITDIFDIEIIKQAFKALNGVKRIILRFLKIKDISFTIPINGENAIQTQKKYAAVTTAFYGLNTFLQRYVKIYYKSPVFVADFANLYSESVYFYCKIQASPSIILVIGYYLYKNYKSTFIKYIVKEK